MLDVFGVVLVIGVGVDDQVGAFFDAGFQAGDETGGETSMLLQAHDVLHAGGSRCIGGAVAAAVINDQKFDLVYALQSPGKGLHGGG
jgi:hypothetical protein